MKGKTVSSPLIFDGVPDRDTAYLLRHGRLIHFRVGESVFESGDASRCLYVMVHGEVGIYEEGRMKRVCRSGDTFGETGLLGPLPQQSSAIAMTKTDVFRICGDRVQELLAAGRGRRLLRNVVTIVSGPPAPLENDPLAAVHATTRRQHANTG